MATSSSATEITPRLTEKPLPSIVTIPLMIRLQIGRCRVSTSKVPCSPGTMTLSAVPSKSTFSGLVNRTLNIFGHPCWIETCLISIITSQYHSRVNKQPPNTPDSPQPAFKTRLRRAVEEFPLWERASTGRRVPLPSRLGAAIRWAAPLGLFAAGFGFRASRSLLRLIIRKGFLRLVSEVRDRLQTPLPRHEELSRKQSHKDDN